MINGWCEIRSLPEPFLVLLLLGIACTGLTAQVDEEGVPDKPDEQEKQLIRVLHDLRDLYMDVYPFYRRLKQLRNVGGEASRKESIKEEIQNRTRDRLPSILERLNALRDTDGTFQQKVRKVRKEVYGSLEKFIERFLNDWSPENPDRVEAMSINERINNDVAGPALLRRFFLVRLTEHLRKLPTAGNNISKRIDRLEKKLDPMFWSMVEKFTDLLGKVEKAREEQSDSSGDSGEEKADTKTKNDRDGTPKKNEKDRKEKTLQAVREANRDWNQFIRKKQEQHDQLMHDLNRVLSLYRDREYLFPGEKELRQKALSIKRRMGQMRRLQDREKPFSDPDKIRKTLLNIGRVILKSKSRVLQGANWPSDVFERMSERPELENLNRERYRSKVSSIKLEKEKYDRYKKNTYAALEEACQTVAKHTKPVADRLLDSDREKAKKVGKLLSELHRITSQAHRRLKQDSRANWYYHKTFVELSFQDGKSFKKRFTERIRKMQKKIYGTTKEQPEPTGQQLENQLRELRQEITQNVGKRKE